MTENAQNISFEESLRQLETIVRKLESGDDDLEKSIKDYEEGTKLIKLCEKRLNEAKLKVEKITQTPDGEVKLEEFI